MFSYAAPASAQQMAQASDCYDAKSLLRHPKATSTLEELAEVNTKRFFLIPTQPGRRHQDPILQWQALLRTR